MTPSNNPQAIEKLRERYDSLKTKKITAEANLEMSRKTLEALKTQAREQYGTDDLDALRAKLEEMTQDNERKRAEYQEHLTKIETQLAEVETQHTEIAEKEDSE